MTEPSLCSPAITALGQLRIETLFEAAWLVFRGVFSVSSVDQVHSSNLSFHARLAAFSCAQFRDPSLS